MKKTVSLALMVGLIGAAVPAWARTVNVLSQNATSVTLGFGSEDRSDYELFVASGATDSGDDKHAWEAFTPVAAIPGDQDSYTYEVPEVLRDGRYLRFFLMQRWNLACAKELQWVKSTSQQWVDTGLVPTTRTVVDFRFGDVTYANSTAFFGQNWTGSRYLLNQQSSSFYFHAGGVKFSIQPQANTDYRVLVDEDSYVHLIWNGQAKRFACNRNVDGSMHLAIFGCVSGDHLATFRCYRMKIANMNPPTMQRDFVPALNAEGEAGLYDQLNNIFYKSKTAIPLVAGPEQPADRFGRVVGETLSVTFHRSVKIAGATDSGVSLAFGNPRAQSHKLYLASGSKDGGDDKHAWENFTELATIAPDQTTYEYAFPSRTAPAPFYRFFLLQTLDLPYSTEIASITSTGAQGIQLDYIPNAQTTSDFKFGNVTYANATAFYGQGWQGYNYLLNQQSNKFMFHSTGNNLEAAVLANTDYRVRVTENNTLVMTHGNVQSEFASIDRRANPLFPMAVFSCYSITKGCAYRFDSLRLWDHGFLARDLVPVVANGQGALFDRVNGRVYFRADNGAADFMRGAALGRQGWAVAQTETLGEGVVASPEVSLTEDTDWSNESLARLSQLKVRLNNYKLTLAAAEDSSAFPEIVNDGTLEINVAAGKTWTMPAVPGLAPVTAAVRIVKTGPGTLVLERKLPNVRQILVNAGTVRMGGYGLLPNGTPVVVKNGGTFDLCGCAENCVDCTIEGFGPDGKGALRNTAQAMGILVNSTTVGHLMGITLTGDAGIYTTADHLGLMNSNSGASKFELNGHTLTMDYASGAGFWFMNVTSATAGTVYVKRGIPYFYHNSYQVNLPNVDFILDGPNSIFRIPTSGYASKTTVRSVTLQNGAKYEEGNNNGYMQNFSVLNSGEIGASSNVKWIYLAKTLLVSNETDSVTIYPPITANSTYPQLVKKGAGTLYIKNNHTDQRMDRGLDLQGGTVVMDSTASTKYYERAISSQPVPVTIHAGATLDMRNCTSPFKLSALDVEAGGTLLHTSGQRLAFTDAIFKRPQPFTFAGTVEMAGTATFDLGDLFSSANPPAAGSTLRLLEVGTAILSSAEVVLKGCPYEYDFTFGEKTIDVTFRNPATVRPNPIKIWTVGGNYVLSKFTENSQPISFRLDLAQQLEAAGWNVQMTGWRTVNPRLACGFGPGNAAWKGHAGVQDLALKTSATRAGLLEGLEAYCAAANEPDFTILVCGDIDVADGVSDAKVLDYLQQAVNRIKAALPMTTVIVSTIPGASTSLNNQIASWCAGETEVVGVDLANVLGTNPARSHFEQAATTLKTLLQTLATPNGKLTPTTWTRPAVASGAVHNVPAEYRAGFTHVRTMEPPASTHFTQNLEAIPYTYAPAAKLTDIAKVGYYLELIRKDTGALQAVWVDMDAPGSAWADVAFPVTIAQQKQRAVTKLHVWSNSGVVSQVQPNDDSVEGYIEFNCLNYSGTEVSAGTIAEPKSGAYGFNDTFNTSGSNGHACFQVMRKFADASAFPAGEVLITITRWGSSSENVYGIGIGTLANYGNHGWTTSADLDRTFCYGDPGTDAANISSPAYTVRKLEFWLKYANGQTPSREATADGTWAGGSDLAFATPGNWSATGGGTLETLAGKVLRLASGQNAAFTYSNVDAVELATSQFLLDGTATFAALGGLSLQTLDLGATGRLVLDPVKFSLRLATPPTFASGAKITLTSNYAAATKGRFLLMTWDNGALAMDATALASLFDTTSAHGTDVQVTVENLEKGGRLWLDLDASGVKPRLNILAMGDSITQGSDGTYGNWRTLLMKKAAAAGYEPVAKGYWKIESGDICKAVMPENWTHHAGISGQRLVTRPGGGAGTLDAVAPTLDQAGDVDFVLVKLGTNDINSDNASGASLFAPWTNLVWQVLTQKPHAKFIAGAVVDIAYDETKNAQVQAFNALMQKAIEVDHLFPAHRAYFADLYTPCYRFDRNGVYIPGSFYADNNLHPDWPGEEKMAEVYLNAIVAAMNDQDADSQWQPGAEDLNVPTSSGAEQNVPAEYRAGLRRARVLDLAAHAGEQIHSLPEVPYEPFAANAAPIEDLSRVGYYIELRRRNDAQSDFHGLVRWLWVSMDAFGSRTIDDVGVPRNAINQWAVHRLRVKTNMPGIAETAADASDVNGWVEFWPSSYNGDPSGIAGVPGNFYGYDWNDTCGGGTSGFGSMQVFRLTPGCAKPAELLFSFNHWTTTEGWEIGLGNFANQVLSSLDWTFSGSNNKNMRTTMGAEAYDVARLEIWTAGMADDPDLPSASVTVDGVAMDGGTATVTGTVADFGTGATGATLTLEWSTDPTFSSDVGSQNVGAVTATGEVTVDVANLDPTKDWYFRFVSTNDRGVGAHSTPYNGGFVTTAPVAFWRSQSSGDTWQSSAWQLNGEGQLKAFESAWQACFDGAETARTGTVAIPGPVAADRVTVAASSDYTFAGTGTITARELVKTGSGKLTLEDGVLAGVRDLDIRAGVVKLGDTAVPGAAGLDGGTITVRNGAQFDVNYNDATGGVGRPRARITGEKKFVIEGAGPDGNGALTSTYTGSSSWSSVLGLVELAGDATIGGTSRMDMRDTSAYGLTGPHDATLTVKNSHDPVGLNLHGTTSVGKIVIDPVGRLCLESTSFGLDVPDGIDVYGTLNLWGAASTAVWNVDGVRAKGNAATFYGGNGTSYLNAEVTVEPEATLTLTNNTIRYTKTFINAGTVNVISGSHYFDGDLVNVGNPLVNQTEGSIYNYANRISGDSRVVVSGSKYYWTKGNQDWGDSVLDVTLRGAGSLVLGKNDDSYGLPKFGKYKLRVTAENHTGTFFLHNGASASIDGLQVTGLINNFYSQGPSGKAIVDIQAKDLIFAAKSFQVGTGSGFGELTVRGADTDITATTLTVDTNGNNAHRGAFTFEEGLLTIGTGGITTAWRQPMWPLFTMAGGTLRAGADFALTQPGMTAVFGSPQKGGAVTIDLNGHNVNWNTGLTGASDVTITGTGSFGPDRSGIQGIPTGKWTVDTTSPVDLRNAAGFAGGLELAENARATLDIAGTNLVEFIFWTWKGNAWNQMRPRAYGTQSLFSPHLATSLTYINRAPTTVTDVKHGSGTGFNYTGQFYVSAERAGKWYFAHNCKTHSGIIIDGVELSTPGSNSGSIVNKDLAEGWHDFMLSFYNSGSGQIGPNSGDGVHSFWFKVGGSGNGTWPADYTPFDVDNVPMRMRPSVNARTSLRWRRYLSYENSVNVYQTADESLYTTLNVITNSLQFIHTKLSTGKNAPLGGSSTRIDGYFYVSPERAGSWTFTGGFDDNVAIEVDGYRLFATSGCGTASGNTTLGEGWHRYKLLLGDNTKSDNTTSGTGGLVTDSHGNVAAMMFSANGAPTEAFDERYVPLAYQPGDAQKYEQPGLGGETKLAAGSTLVNDTPLTDAFCPIYGTLSGSGTLEGPFRFTGEGNCWKFAGAGNRRVPADKTSFENADAKMFAGLKNVQATFDRKPTLPTYELADSPYGLTGEAAGQVQLSVKDVDGEDYTENFSLAVRDNKLVLVNSRPGGLFLYFR